MIFFRENEVISFNISLKFKMLIISQSEENHLFIKFQVIHKFMYHQL